MGFYKTSTEVSKVYKGSTECASVYLGTTEIWSNVELGSVTTNAASSVTTTSMTLNGNVTNNGGGTISSRGFYFGTSSNYASNTKYTVGSGTGSFSTTRTSLSSNTTYYITAWAINEAGEFRGSTISQKTAYPYTFTNTNHHCSSEQSGARLRRYYENVEGSWVLLGTVAPFGVACINHETSGQRNRAYASGGVGDRDWDVFWFRTNYADNGCGTIASTSNRVISGTYTGVTVTSSNVVVYGWTAVNLYYDVP